MEIPQELDEYLRETIDDSFGLPVSTQTLRLKLRASEDAHRRIRDQCLVLDEKLREKEQLLDRAKAEATMNAVALKKFVEENQKLAAECSNLVAQCKKWERECTLYDNDREALMEFGNEADERAKDAETRVHELEVALGNLSEELKFYKHQYESRGIKSDGLSAEITDLEGQNLESILTTLTGEDAIDPGRAFLEANREQESCRKLLKIWSSLKPSTQKVLSLASKVSILENEKEHLGINLARAEEEVELLFQENKILNEENRKLVKQLRRASNLDSSAEKQSSSASAKVLKNRRGRRNLTCALAYLFVHISVISFVFYAIIHVSIYPRLT
ncbi:unnamed protein product [Linum tenue]|uniref:Uncharacterized protein n=1 Tax=Linum tenue TaxID=586396 RepID=A0AAV0MNM0_9ROSI|nr:unnamed protein product [Linum tenue]